MSFRRFARYLRNPSKAVRLALHHARWSFYKRWQPLRPFEVNLGNSDLHLALTASDALAYSIYWQGSSEPEIFEFMRWFLEPGMIMFDLGANIGQYTLLAAQCVGSSGQVHSFEPANREFSLLSRNVFENGFGTVILQQKAIGAFDGTALIKTFPNGYGAYNTLGKPSHRVVERMETHEQRVECLSLDSYILSNNITQIDLLKIDVEGGEVNVLHGAAEILSSDDAPLIICEFGDETLAGFNYRGDDLYDCFENLGYMITEITSVQGQLRLVERQSRYGANYVAVKPQMLSKWNLVLTSEKQ